MFSFPSRSRQIRTYSRIHYSTRTAPFPCVSVSSMMSGCDARSMAGLPQADDVAPVHAAAAGMLEILAARRKRRR